MHQYSAPELLLIIAALSAMFTQMIGAWRLGDKVATIKEKVDSNTTKTEETLVKAAVIEGHVNSREAKLTEQISSYQKEVDSLKRMLVDKDKTAALLAQAAVRPPLESALPVSPQIPVPLEVVIKPPISEVHTKD